MLFQEVLKHWRGDIDMDDPLKAVDRHWGTCPPGLWSKRRQVKTATDQNGDKPSGQKYTQITPH